MTQEAKSKPKILLLESNAFLHQYLDEFLKFYECETSFVHDAATALAHAHAKEFDLVYLDAAGIGQDLTSFIQSLKPKGKSFKILVANVSAPQEAQCQKLDIDALKEPVRPEELTRHIKQLVSLRAKASSSGDFLRILVVDDEEELCNFIADHFESEGFQTYRAYNGKGAIELAHRHHCNVAIVDVKLPQVRGEELANLWKKGDSSMKEVILITGGVDENMMSLKRKGLSVFQKPIDIAMLTELVTDLSKKNGLTLKTAGDK